MSEPVEGVETLLLFRFGGRVRAVEASAVQQVVRAVALEELPGAPPHVEGVLNLRGQVVPVLDLRPRLGADMPASISDHFIVLDAGHRLVALRCDEALDLLEVEADERRPGSEAAGDGAAASVVARPEGVLVVHDVKALLCGAEGEQLEEALRHLAGDGA